MWLEAPDIRSGTHPLARGTNQSSLGTPARTPAHLELERLFREELSLLNLIVRRVVRSAADAVLYQRGTIESDAFLHTLAESLVLSGQAMVIAGTSRPCSGACHEISHAIDLLFPDRRGYHGEQVGVGAAFATFLRKDEERLEQIVAALRWHDLPVVPQDLGLSVDEFTRVVLAAPQTRPGRHTILEELSLSDEGTGQAVEDYIDVVSGPAWA